VNGQSEKSSLSPAANLLFDYQNIKQRIGASPYGRTDFYSVSMEKILILT